MKPLRIPPTRKQILAEVKRLKEVKPKLIRYSGFGDDHYAEIDAQIEVLESALGGIAMTEDDIYDQRWYENVEACAFEAVEWLTGESEEDNLVGSWKGLIQ